MQKNQKNAAYEDKTIETSNSRQVPFAVIESYKTIRTNLLFLLSQSNRKIVSISSSMPGEGKSSCAVNLAIAFSQLGSKVLLIDGDLRKPSVYRKLKIQNSKGLSSVLVGFCNASEAIAHINPNFDVLVSGPTPPNPPELLGSENMSNLLDSLNEIYDYIIIDTPPVNVVSDALVLATKTEGIVLIAQNYRTTHDQFKKAVASVNFANVKLLGVVLNTSGSKGMGYYNKYRYKRYQY